MAKKKLKIGSLLVQEREFDNPSGKVKKKMISLGLGNTRNKDPKYNLSVELIVKDHTGAVVHRQENGFVNLVDPRTQPDELYAAGFLDEGQYQLAKERAGNIPDFIKYNIEISK